MATAEGQAGLYAHLKATAQHAVNGFLGPQYETQQQQELHFETVRMRTKLIGYLLSHGTVVGEELLAGIGTREAVVGYVRGIAHEEGGILFGQPVSYETRGLTHLDSGIYRMRTVLPSGFGVPYAEFTGPNNEKYTTAVKSPRKTLHNLYTKMEKGNVVAHRVSQEEAEQFLREYTSIPEKRSK